MGDLAHVGSLGGASPNALSSIGVPFSPSAWLVPSPPPTNGSAMATDFSASNGTHHPAHSHRYASTASARNYQAPASHDQLQQHFQHLQQSGGFGSHAQPPLSSAPHPGEPSYELEEDDQPPLPFDPTYPHLIPILSPNQPPHLPHQLPSPFLATHQSLPWTPDATSGLASADPTTTQALNSDSIFSDLPSPFLSASVEAMPDDFDGEVDDFVHGQVGGARAHGRMGSHSSGSSSETHGMTGSKSREIRGMSPRREPRIVRGDGDGRELDRRRTGKRELLTIAPSVTFNLPDLPAVSPPHPPPSPHQALLS